MTLNFEDYCIMQKSFELELSDETEKGENGQLFAALVLAGSCKIEPAEPVMPENFGGAAMDELMLLYGGGDGELLDTGGKTLCTGELVLCRAPAVLTPHGACLITGALLCGAAAAEALAQLGMPLVLSANKNPEATSLLQQLSAQPQTPAGASALAYSFLCHVAAGDAQNSQHPPLVAAAIEHIREHYAEVYGVEELAEALGVNKSYLIRTFTAAAGISPGKYLTETRIENAKRFLLQGSYPLEVIAGLCGFSGSNYFCKVFKKETGETPAAWRKKMLPQAAAASFEDSEPYEGYYL